MGKEVRTSSFRSKKKRAKPTVFHKSTLTRLRNGNTSMKRKVNRNRNPTPKVLADLVDKNIQMAGNKAEEAIKFKYI